MQAALERVRRLEYTGGETTSQDSQDSSESLLWDSVAQNFVDPFAQKRLWSSSTTSTHFDVTVVKSESLSEDMVTAGLEISDQDLRDAGPSGLQDQGTRALHGDAETTGGSVDTVSLLSTDTILPRKFQTPAPRNSRPNTPATVGLQIRPLTPLLCHGPPVPHGVSSKTPPGQELST